MNKIFTIKTENNCSENKKVEAFYKKAMEELKDFYIVNWTENTPVLFLVNSNTQIFLLTTNYDTNDFSVNDFFTRDLSNPK